MLNLGQCDVQPIPRTKRRDGERELELARAEQSKRAARHGRGGARNEARRRGYIQARDANAMLLRRELYNVHT